ncbi:spore germination protein [Paenibacillus sp. UNC499MF]|uniref:spore germination protein n=1 Tax=Paenibacillus sp. UNC499MF TaxID=1502751 RepID=UPI00089FC53E|nr:spore germination protein [Paenibacillus sp. UNC499MF]SEF91298.1 spore germination protein [Paenibacillus sp. UNC499MF]
MWNWMKNRKTGSPLSGIPMPEPQMVVPSLYIEDILSGRTLSAGIEENLKLLQDVLQYNDDLTVRRFQLFEGTSAALVFFSSFADQEMIRSYLIKPLMTHTEQEDWIVDYESLAAYLTDKVIQVSRITEEKAPARMIDQLTMGETVLLVDGIAAAFLADTRKIEKRSIEQPQTEQVIRGPREGFIEHLQTNIALIRYRLQTADFRVHTMHIGRVTKSKVALCYIQGITQPALIHEAKKRLSSIDTDSILDAGYIEQFIEDHPLSPFPQIQNTERPDKTVAALLEGKFVIMVDGSPFALIAPTVFSQFYQTVDDYTERFLIGSMIRFIRLVALLFSLVFPSLYVAVISFNPEVIPTDFAVAVAGSRAGVPYPAMIEVLLMEISMEVLREATIRLPQLIGGALSIVGVLVIGQAAVSAGFSSPITVVIIALTTVGSFATPAYNAAIALRMLRFPLIVLAGCFGLYGIMFGMILITNHLLSIRSFGVPYMSPITPFNAQEWKDTLLRGPIWWMTDRPGHLKSLQAKRRLHIDRYYRSPSYSWDKMPEDPDKGGVPDE